MEGTPRLRTEAFHFPQLVPTVGVGLSLFHRRVYDALLLGSSPPSVQGVFVAPHRLLVTQASLVSIEAVVPDGTDYDVFTLYNMGTAGAVVHTIGTLDTSSVGLVQYTPRDFTLTTDAGYASRIVEKGEFVKAEFTIEGNGAEIMFANVYLYCVPLEG